jgi:hypothetical protein
MVVTISRRNESILESGVELFDHTSLFTEHFSDATYISLTDTMLNKSIMDAVDPIRKLLKDASLHDFDTQAQGPENKVVLTTILIGVTTAGEVFRKESSTSLYRPNTKNGDPRFWVRGLRESAIAGDFVGFAISSDGKLVVANLSLSSVQADRRHDVWQKVHQHFSNVVALGRKPESANYLDLISKLSEIAQGDYLKAVGYGDTAVGRTLEHALGIRMNSSRNPDWHGIELKFGRRRPAQRKNLFAQVPDWTLSPITSIRNFLGVYGYHRNGLNRLNCTVSPTPNSQGLALRVDLNRQIVEETSDNPLYPVALVWTLEKLNERLLEKHTETCWITVDSKFIDGIEFFKPKLVIHTSSPRTDLVPILISSGQMTVDHMIKQTGTSVTERGPEWKVSNSGHAQLFTELSSVALV